MRTMLFLGTVCCVLIAVLAGCDDTAENAEYGTYLNGDEHVFAYETPAVPNELTDNATLDSTFSLFVYDGETTIHRVIFDWTIRRRAFDELRNVPAVRVTDWTLDDITLPIYGISMTTRYRRSEYAAWSNGFWITHAGDVYRFDFDFESFIERRQWHPRYTRFKGFLDFPNAFNLTRDSEGWRTTLLTPRAELNPPEGIEMAFVSNTNENVTFTLTNNNDAYWSYGMGFWIDALLDGVWYPIPTAPGRGLEILGIAFHIKAGQTETSTYDLNAFGDLPPGTYRLVKYGMYVVFEID